MKQKDIVIGRTYAVKVSGAVAPVRITERRIGYNGRANWLGINTRTGRMVRILSAQKMRRELPGN